MATADSVKTKIQGLIARANAATNGSDTNLTAALDRLIAGFGKGGGPYSDVTLLSTIEAPEDVSAIKIDWQPDWIGYDYVIFRPKKVTLSAADWLYYDINDTGKKKYSEKLSVFDEDYTFGFKYNPSIALNSQFKMLLGYWEGTLSLDPVAISYIYIQPYTSTTLIKGESKIEILGVNFA